jgi:hypothetical protein
MLCARRDATVPDQWPSAWLEAIAMSGHAFDKPKNIVPFAPSPKEPGWDGSDSLDKSGHQVFALLQQAADVAKENSERAMSLAHRLSIQLRVAEDRIRTLEADLEQFQDRALRAENWLLRIQKEIEDRFLEDPAQPGQQPTRR